MENCEARGERSGRVNLVDVSSGSSMNVCLLKHSVANQRDGTLPSSKSMKKMDLGRGAWR